MDWTAAIESFEENAAGEWASSREATYLRAEKLAAELRTALHEIRLHCKDDANGLNRRLSADMGNVVEVLAACASLQGAYAGFSTKFQRPMKILEESVGPPQKMHEFLKMDVGLRMGRLRLNRSAAEAESYLQSNQDYLQILARCFDQRNGYENRLESFYLLHAKYHLGKCFRWARLTEDRIKFETSVDTNKAEDNLRWVDERLKRVTTMAKALRRWGDAIDLMSNSGAPLSPEHHGNIERASKAYQSESGDRAVMTAAICSEKIYNLLALKKAVDSATVAVLHKNIPVLALPGVFVGRIEATADILERGSAPQLRAAVDLFELFAAKFVDLEPDLKALIELVSEVPEGDPVKDEVLQTLRLQASQVPGFEFKAYEVKRRAQEALNLHPDISFPSEAERREMCEEHIKSWQEAHFKMWQEAFAKARCGLPEAPPVRASSNEPADLDAISTAPPRPSKNARKNKARKEKQKAIKSKASAAVLPETRASGNLGTDEIAPEPQSSPALPPPTDEAEKNALKGFIRYHENAAQKILNKRESGGSPRFILRSMRAAANLVANHLERLEQCPPSSSLTKEIADWKDLERDLRSRGSDMARRHARALFAADPLKWARVRALWSDPACQVYKEKDRKKTKLVFEDGSPYFEPYFFLIPHPDPQSHLSVEIHPHFKSLHEKKPDFIKFKYEGASFLISHPDMVQETVEFLSRAVKVASHGVGPAKPDKSFR